MLKRFYIFTLALLCSLITAWAGDVTVSPTLDVNFRTGAGNTAWNNGYPKSAADEGNKDFELTYAAGLFALQKYTVPDLANATKLVLTLTVGSKSGVDAVRVWAFANNTWTAASGIDDIVNAVTAQTGLAPRATEGTANSPLATGAKVAESNPAKATFTITGTALATIKANATEDGTFTLLLTNNDLTNSNNKRSYLSINDANDEANRPTLTATIEAPSVVNKTTGVGYSTLEEAFDAAVAAETDAELEVSADQKLSKRMTLNKAITITITPTTDITIKGQKNAMWFLANVNDATLKIGSKEHKITFDGISDDRSTFTNVDVTRRENNTKLYLTNIEFKDFTCGANHLVGCKNAGGAIYLEDITFSNCSSTDALISNLREANDALLLKGFFNVENCTGTTIYTAKNRIRLGDPDGTTIYNDFSASNVITIGWGGTFAEGTNVIVKVPASATDKFQLVSEEWSLARNASNGDMYMTKPAAPTAKIGDQTYADLKAALAAVQDGETITLLDDQEISARVNIKNMSITINGGKTIKRASSYTNGILFLTAKPGEGEEVGKLTLDGITIDGQDIEATATTFEAGNNGTITLKNVTFQNCKNTKADGKGIIDCQGGGTLVLDGANFTNCAAPKGTVFVGTNNVTLKGNNTIASIFVEKNLALTADEATHTTPITLITDGNRTYGMIVIGGTAAAYVNEAFRLSQQPDGVYTMPKAVANTYAHPGLLHTVADIETAKARLTTEPYAAAYAALETASSGDKAGAVEWLKRMDKNNWESIYPDYNNFSRAANDAKLAYELALRYQLKGATAAADKAVSILNDWATNCKGILRISGKGYADNVPDPNEYLILIQAYQFANAAELVKGYTGFDEAKFNTWMKETFADFAILFLENHHNNANPLHYWLNWDLAAQNALMSIGVLTDDKALVDYAMNYVDNGSGTGNKANAIVATHNDTDTSEILAQCQESGRDQGHATLDVTLLGVLCQTAQNVGVEKNLWQDYKALEMAEYVGKYNLKKNDAFVYDNVPFTTYSNGEVTHTAISAEARGSERPCWELFHAYAKNNGKVDKYTEEWVKFWRAKNAGGETTSESSDELGFGTLMFGATVTTGIDNLNVNANANFDANAPMYNLAGQKVGKNYKGVAIQNGKKMIVK